MGSRGWEKDFGDSTLLNVTAWGGYYSRFSQRQAQGGFGTVATGTTNNIEFQEFWTKGIEGRVRHDWFWGENVNTFASGVMFYHTDSPRLDMSGASPSSSWGAVLRDTDRDVFYAPLFIENRFTFGKLSVTPGVRLENIWQNVKENVNTAKAGQGTPLGNSSDYAFVPLVGVGVEYEFFPGVQAYGNASQSYRPKIFTEAVPTGGGAVVNGDLEEGSAWQYEIGFRGQPRPYVTWDTSLFLMDFDNQIGTSGNTVANIGRTVHRGVEAAVEVELLGLSDALSGRPGIVRHHQFSLYGNVMILDAEIRSGANAYQSIAYAPDYTVRAGAIYRWRDRAKLALTGTLVDDHWADDAHTLNRFIPSYMVWDLTLECKVYRDNLSLLAGINNLFDEDYFARVRNDGIDPAYRRNFYAGISLAF
jgi:Fe(3+) dicitrate transport protein